MVAIAGELFDCEVVTADTSRPSKYFTRFSQFCGRELGTRATMRPACSYAKARRTCWLSSMLRTGASDFAIWPRGLLIHSGLIIFPRSIRLRNPFDHIFVTSLEDVDRWRDIRGGGTTWLPWGTDALRLGQSGADRDWDLTRVGRQPPEWEDDLRRGVGCRIARHKIPGSAR